MSFPWKEPFPYHLTPHDNNCHDYAFMPFTWFFEGQNMLVSSKYLQTFCRSLDRSPSYCLEKCLGLTECLELTRETRAQNFPKSLLHGKSHKESCESRHRSRANKVQDPEIIFPNTECISMLFSKTNTSNAIYCWNKPDKHRYFNTADKQLFQFVKYMLRLVREDVTPRVIFRKCKQLPPSPGTHNAVIIIFLHDKLRQVPKLPLSYVWLDSEFTDIAFLLFFFKSFCQKRVFIWVKEAEL